MIVLNATNKSLEIKLAAAVALTELPFVTGYVDIETTTFGLSGALETDGVTAGVAAVTIVAAPTVATSRKVNFISVVNVDTAAAIVTVQVNNATVKRIFLTVVLQVGDQLTFTDAAGWNVFDANGNRKQSFNGVLPAANFPALSGDVSTTAGSLVTTIGAAKVTNAMLAGSITVDKGGTGRAAHTEYAVLCGGTTPTAAQQSIASVGTPGQVLTSNGPALLPTFQAGSGSSAPTEETTILTGTVNNFDADARYTYLRANNAAALVITGFTVLGAAPIGGDIIIIDNIGTSTVKVLHENVGSTAANRIITPSTTGQIIGSGGRMQLIYDTTTDRWREVVLEPGAPIAIAFNAAHYIGDPTMTWTVASGDIRVAKYSQRGTIITLIFSVVGTTVGGTPNSVLQWDFGAATGFTIAILSDAIGYSTDNGTVRAVRIAFSDFYNALRFVNIAGSWALSTDNTNVATVCQFEVL